MSGDDTHVFKTSLVWSGGKMGRFASPDRPPLEGASPPEFDGPSGYWSPEELFVGSYEICLLLTFVAVTEKFRIDFTSYESRAEGILEKGERYYRFSKVSAKARVKIPSDRDITKFHKAVEVSKRACFITNSLSCETEFEAEFIVGE